MRSRIELSLIFLPLLLAAAPASDGNRLTYLDGSDPYYVGLNFPKLTTPQWVGEEGVEAVVVLAIDDMRDNAPKYETYLRPILDRLKKIDGGAHLSIMTCRIEPDAPEVKRWLAEGVNLDVHTLTHPCPLLQKDDFDAAKQTYDGCIDKLAQVAGNRAVAFRMPCCDSLNTPSPRFYAEIFNKTTRNGHFLRIDSSVFNITTPDDPALARELVLEPDGRERFRKYLPFPSFVNTTENYPYPFVIGRLCWEFPCVVPSDWEAQHLQEPFNPKTVEDMKAALDCVVQKQGVFNLVFHPHGWIQNSQVVELIDHAVAKHGKKVKFLNFREALERLEKNLLAGESLRDSSGRDNGVRLLDLDNDGFLDVVIGNDRKQETRRWDPKAKAWDVSPLPVRLVKVNERGVLFDHNVRFGITRPDGFASLFVRDLSGADEAWHFDGKKWTRDDAQRLTSLKENGGPVAASNLEIVGTRDLGLRLRDLDGDGICEIVSSRLAQNNGLEPANAIFAWSSAANAWKRLPFGLPAGVSVIDGEGQDAGLRFVDLDEDGHDDVVFSNDRTYNISLFDSLQNGWKRTVISGKAGDAHAIPPIVAGGQNMGFWAHSGQLWWQNEHTAKLSDLVDRRSIRTLLKSVEARGRSAAASLRSLHVRPGFRVGIAAQEPLVEDPIAFDWSADGRLWVVEMGDYPLGTDGKGKPGGVVRVLNDEDGDGRYDKMTVFLDGLPFPTGILPWRKGVLVACAPDIFYAEDRDGDGKADVKEVLFTGFNEGNQQHRLNGFELGLDGWVYGANGDSGGKIRSTKTGESVSIQGRDFRFRPDDGRFEAASGQAQYGRHRDDFGHWFGNNNPTWAWHYVLAEADMKRNASFAAPDPKQMLEPDTRLYPASPTPARFNDLDSAERVTSANSPAPYRDELFGPAFAHALFVSEPVHNLVHRMNLEADGATFHGTRPSDEATREFLASSDNWFRPTMLKTGPDGALWVADMYRAVIEHPEWIPDDWEAKLDLRAGHEQGRIYRVYPVGSKPRPIPRLDQLDTSGLVAALDSPSGWQRDTAMRLLLEKRDKAAAEALRELVKKAKRPQARVQALWTLANLEQLDAASVLAALGDEHFEVRRNAIATGMRLASAHKEVAEALLARADDRDATVRFELALRLGDWNDPRAGRALAKMASSVMEDSWFRAAVLSSAQPHAAEILRTWFSADPKSKTGPPQAYVAPLFAVVVGQPDRLEPLVKLVGQKRDGHYSPWQLAALGGLLDAADRMRPGDTEQLRAARAAIASLSDLHAYARALAVDDAAFLEERLLAVRVLGRTGSDAPGEIGTLASLLNPQASGALQEAAIAALAKLNDRRVPDALIAGWKGHSPRVRAAVFDALLAREAWNAALLDAIESKKIPAGELDLARRKRLLAARDANVRDRASALFSASQGQRAKVIEAYSTALTKAGDKTHGAAVFKKVCATCHKFGGDGVEVGPDLAALNDRSPQALLVAILDPNRAFEAKYAAFSVQTTDGRVLEGLVAAETGNSVTLLHQEGKQDVLLRADIDAMAGTGQSLMPEGLEKDLSPQDVADVIAYIAGSGPARKEVAGNKPEVVRPGTRGTLELSPAQAEIFGPTLTFESKYANLGYWSSEADYAAWTVEIDRPGRYRVAFTWACDPSAAGNLFVLQALDSRVEGKVDSTGSWDNYRNMRVGELTLPAGQTRVELRPVGPIQGALIDLKSIELRYLGAPRAK